VASYVYRGKGWPPHGGETTKRFMPTGVVSGGLFLVLAYAFSHLIKQGAGIGRTCRIFC